jgi:hypothetical protein
MKQQDYLAEHGAIHHYKVDQVLRWMQDRFDDGRVTPMDGHSDTLATLRARIAKLPSVPDHLEVAKDAVRLVASYTRVLRSKEYTNMYAVLESALRDCGFHDGVRAIIKPKETPT